ncbi:MAG: FAD-dependent oxidoreductase [Anaerolineae bacterium]|nr:FAD-dependent oxidoreductase [Anaerolineae bacterium]
MLLDFKLGSEPASTEVSGGIYDIVIIGGGPAGLTAAIYAARDGMRVLVLDRETTGGLAATTEMIENYPGFPEGVNGMELMQRFRQQAGRFGAEIVEFEEVQSVKPIKRGLFEIHTDGDVHQGKTVVIATGSRPKQLNLPGENEYYGKGLSYCATCDGPFFKDKDVVVIGAGNSGLQEGLQVLEYAKSVTFIEFLPFTRAEQILQDRVKAHPKSKMFFNYRVTEIKGDKTVTGVVAVNRETGEEKLFPTDGVFIYVGYSPYSNFVADLVERNKWGYIHTDHKMRTRTEGLYAIGDVRADNPAQLTISAGDGTKAALDIREYLLELAAEA